MAGDCSLRHPLFQTVDQLKTGTGLSTGDQAKGGKTCDSGQNTGKAGGGHDDNALFSSPGGNSSSRIMGARIRRRWSRGGR